MKKVFSLFIILITIFSVVVYAKVYDDVADDAWYKEAVDYVSDRGMMKGSNNSFYPNNQTTRAEYIYALYKSSSESENMYVSDFDDIDENSQFFSSVGWAQKNGIASGVGNNLFAPDESLTREAAMTFLYRAFPQLGIIVDEPKEDLTIAYDDFENISPWAKQSINALLNIGIVKGTDENKIEPQNTLSNAETASMLYNIYILTSSEKTTVEQSTSKADFTSSSYSASSGKKIDYWVFTPQNATANMPMIVYLHGSHSQGDDLNLVLNEDFCQMVSNGDFNDVSAYIVFPQLSSSYRGWGSIQSELTEFIDSLSDKYDADKNNISLVGFSLGGTGTINLATAYPGYFSKIAPIAGGARYIDETSKALSNTSIWAFVGSEDVVVKPYTSEKLIENMKSAGKDAQITIFNGAEHIEVPSLVFSSNEINLVNWLIGK